jgi:hypothetical protein
MDTGGGDITSVSLTAGTGVDITSVSGEASGDYAATIGVDVSDFLATGSNNYVVTATGTDGLKGEANLTFDGTDLTIDGSGKVIFGDANSYIYQSSENFYIRGHNDMYFNIDTPNDAVTRHFIFRANTSTEIMRMGEDKLMELSGDLHLKTDASAIKLGAGQDFTITHDNDIGGTIAGSPVTITSAEACTWSTSSGDLDIVSAGDIHLDAADEVKIDSASGDIYFYDANVDQFHIDLDGTSGEIIFQPQISNDDVVFNAAPANSSGHECLRIDGPAGGIKIGGSGATVDTINTSFSNNDTSFNDLSRNL